MTNRNSIVSAFPIKQLHSNRDRLEQSTIYETNTLADMFCGDISDNV